MTRHVRGKSHVRGNPNDPEFKAFAKRPLTTVTDDELSRWYQPEMVYLNCDTEGVTYK